MKMSLRILRLLLIGLFAVTMLGCGGDDPPPPLPPPPPPEETPEEKLAGEYELIRAETKVDDGAIVAFEPPLAQGSLILVAGGSFYLEFSIEGLGGDSGRGDKWSATDTTLTLGEGDPDSYTLQGTTLTITAGTVILQWKKKA